LSGPSSSIQRSLSALRLRALFIYGARAALAGLGALVLSIAVAALWLGPLAGPAGIAVGWLVALVAVGAGVLWALRRVGDLRGLHVARLYGRYDRTLVSRVKTAAALERSAPSADHVSADLGRAHVVATAKALLLAPPRRIVPLSDVRHRASELGAIASCVGVLLLLASPRASGGFYALLHPAARDPDGAALAAVFDSVDARVVFPAYQAREALEVRDLSVLDVPLGATLEIRARTRVSVVSAEAALGEASAELELDREGNAGARYIARFVVREGGPLTLRARTSDGVWVTDATRREIRTVPDAAPVVQLTEPAEDMTVESDDEIAFLYRAGDDLALGEVSLVIQTADGREERRRVEGLAPGTREHAGLENLRVADLRASPGDRITVFVEARDNDDVTGPHVGRSVSRTLTLASEATRREEGIEELQAIAIAALDRLADRLESTPPDDPNAAIARFARLRSGAEQLVTSLAEFSITLEERPGFRATDAPVYREMANRLRRLTFEERRLHEPSVAALNPRTDIDGRARHELEEDVLALEDLLVRARAEDAAAIARELELLRREIASLLAELRRAETPEARAEVLAAIARAQQRLSDLRARLAAMAHATPSDFANATAAEAEETEEALTALREAVERGDMDAAAQALTRLEQEIDALAQAIGGAGESLGEERFGERDRALAEAIDALMGLETEERELARRSGETRTNAARRAVASIGDEVEAAAGRLGSRVDALSHELDGIDGRRMATVERESLDAVRARLSDARVALDQGDLGEASRMTEEAEARLGDLSRDLDLDSLMFPGHRGETSAAAGTARSVSRGLEALRRDLDAAIPDVERHLDAAERGRMREDVPRQGAAADATGRLRTTFEAGPDGTPISPEGALELDEIEREMRAAAEALDRGDVIEASRAEDEAARRLTELREQLEQDASAQSGGGGGSRNDLDRDVRIPGGDEFRGSMELRRRLLDAMREGTPSGWEDPVRRYYEGLLR
jgi:hypothetical protein